MNRVFMDEIIAAFESLNLDDTIKEIWASFKKSVWALFLPFGLILGLRLGMFTASEAGAMTVVYTVLVGLFVYKELHLKQIPMIMLLIINELLLFLGMFMEGTPTLIIMTPLLVPVITALGIDPIHFGIIMVVNITLGGVTPPFGTIMFVVCSVLKLRITEFVKEVWPFRLALMIVLMIITFCPGLITFLPNLLM